MPRVEKPKSVAQQWKEKKPERPTKPAGRFGAFVGEFARLNACRGKQLIQQASNSWEQLDENARQQYEDADAMNAYAVAMEAYRKTTKAMKRPAESYALFVAHYWQTKRPRCNGSRQQFGQVQKRIAKAWARTPEAEKKAYKAAAEASKVLFRHEQEAVLNQIRELNLDWRPNGTSLVCQILENRGAPAGGRQGGQEAAAAPAPQQDENEEMDVDEDDVDV